MAKQKRRSDASLILEAERIDEVYPKIQTGLSKQLDHKSFQTRLNAMKASVKTTQAADAQRAEAVALKRGERKQLSEFIRRVRNGVASHFGADSHEIALVGYKPTSQRKRPVRKPKLVVASEKKAA